MHIVPDIGTLHPEDDVLGDVGGVVGNALQIASHQEGIQSLAYDLGALVHGLDQLNEGIVAHAVDHVVHFEDGLSQLDFAFNERLQCSTNHCAYGSTHAGNVDGQIGSGELDHIHHALGDVDRLIAHALKI